MIIFMDPVHSERFRIAGCRRFNRLVRSSICLWVLESTSGLVDLDCVIVLYVCLSCMGVGLCESVFLCIYVNLSLFVLALESVFCVI